MENTPWHQGSLKIVMSIIDKEAESTETGRRKFSEGVASKENKMSSVNRLLVLACLPDAQENHETIQMMLDHLNMSGLSFTISSDLKMLGILTGKSGGNLTYGCIFCDAKKPLTSPGNLYTLNNLHQLYDAYMTAGSKKKNQADFQNIVNPPLLEGPGEAQILGLLAPPELHLMLGATDKLRSALEKNVFETKQEGLDFMDRFLERHNIARKSYQGQQSLEGNQTKMFLDSQEKLRAAYMEVGRLQEALPYIETLEALQDVVKQCFGNKLVVGYEESIARFSSLYLKLPETVTPKVHIIMFHVVPYLRLINQDGGERGLGFMSEQAFEAVHAKMITKLGQGYQVGKDHPKFGQRMLDFIVAFNSNNID